jgi:phosphate transport system protein
MTRHPSQAVQENTIMVPTEHTSKQFDSDLEAIRTEVLQMGGLVESQIRAALDGFRAHRPEAIDHVIAQDRVVNSYELRIDEECAHIIARRQPAASDLRMILAVSKAVTDLERIGDEAHKIARMAKQIQERGPLPLPPFADISHVANIALGMLRKALDAFARLDSAQAKNVIAEDKVIDNEFRAILRQLITFMMEDPRTISNALDIIWVAKAVERIGDHSKNIAEYVIYIVEGTDVRHSAKLSSAT